MTARIERLSRLVIPLAIISMALTSIVPSVALARSHATAARNNAIPQRCTHHNKASGTVKYSDWEFPDSLNPFQASQAVSFATINGTQDTLFLYDNNAQVRPQVAAAVPSIKNHQITNGGKTITIMLKKGVRWSNGSELTAPDVKFSWLVSSDASTGPACVGTCDQIASMAVKGKYEVIARLRAIFAPAVPTSFAFVLLPSQWSGAWAKGDVHAAAQKVAQDSTFNFEGPNFPSNGAYQVANFVKDDRILLHPMKYYDTMNCGASVQSLIFVFYSSKPGMIAAAASKATDITGFGGGYTAADLPELRKHTDAYRLFAQASFQYEFLEMNHDTQYNGKANPVHDPNVRVALALALDKVGLIQSALAVTRKQATSFIAWTPWVNSPGLVQPYAYKGVNGQWDPLVKKYINPGSSQAVADAKKLLAKTPYKGGFSLDVFTTSGNPVRAAEMAVIQNNWAKIGVTVVPTFALATKLFGDWNSGSILYHGNFQVALHGFTTNPEPDGNKTVLTTRYIDRRQQVHSPVNNNSSGISDPVMDRAFDIAGHTFDTKVRTAQYKLIQQRMDQQSHWIMLYFRPVIATATTRVKNFSNNPTSAGPTWNVYAYRATAS